MLLDEDEGSELFRPFARNFLSYDSLLFRFCLGMFRSEWVIASA